MPESRAVNTAYHYDGSLAGFYCCVFESFSKKEMPLDISVEADQGSLLDSRWIETREDNALRVRSGIAQRISARALELVETVFYSCMENRELALLRFLYPAFRDGHAALLRLSDLLLTPLLKAERHLMSERHLLCGFIRFVEINGNLLSTIGPKNFVLPYLSEHFSDRYSNDTFLIYDETHQAALFHEPGCRARVARMEQPPEYLVSDEEARYQALWRQFFTTIGIASRKNPVVQRGHMPKRYWGYMVEMQTR
ncbi:DNA metabolism protein [Clostridia bacterium]|nr:DNA metabolism protein [Clostridia bacterium]